MKFFQYSGNCHLSKVLKAAHPSISLIVLLLVTILINPSFASAEVRKEYYPSGKLKSEVNVVNGKKEGLEIKYYDSNVSGQLASETNYKNGEWEGVSKDYF